MRTGRVPCCVPFCGRTAPDDGQFTEILCGRHYRLARPALRRRLARVRRLCRKAALRGERATARRGRRLDDAIWAAIKKEAIEVAVGVAG